MAHTPLRLRKTPPGDQSGIKAELQELPPSPDGVVSAVARAARFQIGDGLRPLLARHIGLRAVPTAVKPLLDVFDGPDCDRGGLPQVFGEIVLNAQAIVT